MRTTIDFRNFFVYGLVADRFEKFARQEEYHYRGENWTPESMFPLIEGEIKKQAFLSGIDEKHIPEMIENGLSFYKKYFHPVMLKIVELEKINRKQVNHE